MSQERNFDINSLSQINSKVNELEGVYFILTGSYAIEALTEKTLIHNDLDSNIFTSDQTKDLPKIATLMESNIISIGNVQLISRTENRLEYDIVADQNLVRRLEIQFVEYNEEKKIIPTTLASLKDAGGKEFVFRVKSLPYSIATWAIRVSGLALDAKRSIRERDLDGFRLLLEKGYNRDVVLLAMSSHPQMPKNMSEDLVLKKALEIISKGE